MSSDYTEDGVEEIVAGLPADSLVLATVDEVATVNRLLLAELRAKERELLICDDLEALFRIVLLALRRALGCRHIELWLHDPVGELEMAIAPGSHHLSYVKLLADSSVIQAPYEAGLRPYVADALRAVALAAVPDHSDLKAVWLVPMLQQGQLVGSLHVADSRLEVGEDSLDAELVHDFIQLIPSMLQRVMEYERMNHLMLLDPVTQCANRAGLSREIQREILRCRRTQKVLAVVALNVCGLEMMDNLSQRHIRARVLRQVSSHIESALRATDYMGRLTDSAFAMLIVDAPADVVPLVAQRVQRELNGTTIEDGIGGIIELEVSLGHTELLPDSHMHADSSQLADVMLDACVRAADCDLGTEQPRQTAVTLPS